LLSRWRRSKPYTSMALRAVTLQCGPQPNRRVGVSTPPVGSRNVRVQGHENRLILALLLLGLLMTTVVQGQDLLINEEFDSGVDDWFYSGGSEAILRWDGNRGMPDPGSLQLSSKRNIGGRNGLFEVMSEECFPVTAGEIVQAEAMVLANRGVGVCFLEIVFFKGPECSGSRSFSGNSPPNTPGVWERRAFTIDVGTTSQTARVASAIPEPFQPGPDHLQLRFRHADARPAMRSPRRPALDWAS
jgi:hypothetical protein